MASSAWHCAVISACYWTSLKLVKTFLCGSSYQLLKLPRPSFAIKVVGCEDYFELMLANVLFFQTLVHSVDLPNFTVIHSLY